MLKKTIKEIIDRLLIFIIGKIKSQEFYERIYRSSLDFMNFGRGAYPEESGEIFVLNYIKNSLKKEIGPINILDVGANVGNYTLLLNKSFNDVNANIFAFEPSEKTYKRLHSNTSGVKNIKAYNFGFGEKNGKFTFYSDTDNSSHASLYNARLDYYNIELKEAEVVEIKTIDSFCQENNIRRIHFLKLDVEGYEFSILRGAQNVLFNNTIDFIQFEFGTYNIASKTYFQDFYYLLSQKYKIYRILRNGLYPIKRYDPLYEIFVTTNYLAQKR